MRPSDAARPAWTAAILRACADLVEGKGGDLVAERLAGAAPAPDQRWVVEVKDHRYHGVLCVAQITLPDWWRWKKDGGTFTLHDPRATLSHGRKVVLVDVDSRTMPEAYRDE